MENKSLNQRDAVAKGDGDIRCGPELLDAGEARISPRLVLGAPSAPSFQARVDSLFFTVL